MYFCAVNECVFEMGGEGFGVVFIPFKAAKVRGYRC